MTRLAKEGGHVLPRTIVSVLDSPDVVKDAALAWALSLARWYDSSLHIVHVSRARRSTAAVENARRDELVRRIHRIAEASGAAGTEVVPAVLSGRPVPAIAEYSRRVAADLVVVTNRVRRSSGYWIAGSFAAALGKAVASPTIVLPDGPLPSVGPGSPFRNIVSAIDFSEASFGAFSAALNLVQQSAGRLRLLHVLDGFPYQTVYGGSDALRLGRAFRASAARITRELQSLVPSDALDWSEIDAATVLGEAHEAILIQASQGRADLVVLGLPRRTRLEEIVAGSTAHKVLRRAASPVLLVPGPATPPRLLPRGHGSQLGLHRSLFGARTVEGGEATTSWG